MNPILAIAKKRISQNKNLIIMINGPTGSGKSYTGVEIGDEIAKEMGTPFTIEGNVGFTFEKLLKKTMLPENQKPGTVFIFEEVGAIGSGASSRQWQSQANNFFFSFMQTSRHRNNILIMTCPHFTYLEKGTRQLVHMRLEMKGIDHKKKIAYVKPLMLQVSTTTGKIYMKYPRMVNDGKKVKIKEVAIPMPRKDLVEIYEKEKMNFTTELNANMFKPKNSMREVLKPNKECPYCQYKWHSLVKEPKKCPNCTKKLHSLAIQPKNLRNSGHPHQMTPRLTQIM